MTEEKRSDIILSKTKAKEKKMNALLQADGSDWLSGIISTLSGWALNTGIKIVIALVILFISFRIIKSISRKIAKKGNNNAKTDYGLPICDKCGKEILSAGTYNPQQIAELGIKNFGKKLCIDCYRKEKGKQNG